MSRKHANTFRLAAILGIVQVSLVALVIGGCPVVPPADDGGGGTPPPPTTGNSGLTGKYIGSETCRVCHSRTHTDWTETLHARALVTLENIGQANNPVCLPCHTVGFGQDGGFVNRATTDALAGVGCETCHGPARDHAENAADRTLRPTVDISSTVCGDCHTGSHHPHFDEWATSGHGRVTPSVAGYFAAGRNLNACGKCHSGDMYWQAILRTETVADNALQGLAPEQMNAVTCAICHAPHSRTGNAPTPEDGRDFQLRFPEVASPTPTNTIDATTNAARFNLCGQCHHDRGTDWTPTARGPHHSVQSNVYVGEMPMPASIEPAAPLVFSRVSVHSFAREQCATCHLYRQDFQSEIAPAIAGHTFEVNQQSCATAGCHPSQAQALSVQATLQTEIQGRIDEIRALLGSPSDWDYSMTGGPADQSVLPDSIRQARFLLKYVEADGSLGMHNPAYVRDMLVKARDLIVNEPNWPLP